MKIPNINLNTHLKYNPIDNCIQCVAVIKQYNMHNYKPKILKLILTIYQHNVELTQHIK